MQGRPKEAGRWALIVDPDEATGAFVRDVLAGRGLECAARSSGSEAREVLQSFVPDVLVVPPRLPDGSGLLLAQFARVLNPRMRIVVLSERPVTVPEGGTLLGRRPAPDDLLRAID